VLSASASSVTVLRQAQQPPVEAPALSLSKGSNLNAAEDKIASSLALLEMTVRIYVTASEAKQSEYYRGGDCFVTLFLAMTWWENPYHFLAKTQCVQQARIKNITTS
jgi:hypothetical protein